MTAGTRIEILELGTGEHLWSVVVGDKEVFSSDERFKTPDAALAAAHVYTVRTWPDVPFEIDHRPKRVTGSAR